MKLKGNPYIPIEPEINGKGYEVEPTVQSGEPFSTYHFKDDITLEDLQELRAWKNKVIEIRDRNKHKPLYEVFDKELKLIVDFLQHIQKTLD